ncbi:MAG TPA: hypothetical protein VLJ61_17925 [Pyrinomonadaceae bacterium]|nr:hypothetical protein [Pyrinomonadaceae bacterium]
MNEQDQQVEQFTPAREFALWLRAVQSFFNTANHPLSAAERADISTRNFKCETRVVHDVLLRCLHLLGGVEQGEQAQGFSDLKNSLGDLSDTLKDAFGLSGALLEAQAVSSGGWAGLGSVLERELKRSDAAAQITKAGQDADTARVPAPLVALAKDIGPDELGEDMLAIFSAFARLLALLRFIESSLRGDAKLKRLLAVFALVNEETRSLLDFIEGRALRVEGLEKGGREILDGTAYAIRMELRKAFEHELVGFCSIRQPPQIFARSENACGLLRDCYQQSVVALAQNFDPSLRGEKLFESFETKLEQSLALRRDLWRLIKIVRTASADANALTPAQLLEGINAFHEGSLRHLMYKDWEPLERFVEEIESARSPAELSQTLHRFEAFLETLFGQVNMRAVLDGHPFDTGSAEY